VANIPENNIIYKPTIMVDESVIDDEFLIPKAPVADIIIIRPRLIIRNIAFTNPLHLGLLFSTTSGDSLTVAFLLFPELFVVALLAGSLGLEGLFILTTYKIWSTSNGLKLESTNYITLYSRW
jgi:hypothetical protein